MTQVVLNIASRKKWNALKTILELMDIEYTTVDANMSERETDLLQQAKNDKENARLSTYTSHRDILGRASV
jgi:hypothetical protein